MFTEQFFDLLLDCGDEWIVKEVRTNLESNEVDIYVEYFGNDKVYDYAPARRWRHLDMMQFRTFYQLGGGENAIGENSSRQISFDKILERSD